MRRLLPLVLSTLLLTPLIGDKRPQDHRIDSLTDKPPIRITKYSVNEVQKVSAPLPYIKAPDSLNRGITEFDSWTGMHLTSKEKQMNWPY